MPLLLILLLLGLLLALIIVAALIGALLSLVPWILVGLLAGWAASAITRSPHGVVGNIIIGLVGSVIGGVLYEILTGHGPGGPFSPARIVMAIAGAVVLLVVVRAFGGREAVA